MGAQSKILLLDCDAMFCEVARSADPQGAGRARELVVGGVRGSRGVVCSASYGAREKGVRAGMPLGMAQRLCPEAMFVPVPRREVGEKSAEVKKILLDWTPAVEAASVDEFYLDMTGMDNIYKKATLEELAHRIRNDVTTRAGIPVSIGGATNKLVAKMAVEEAKPRKGGNGVSIVQPGCEAEWMGKRLLSDIPGVGPKAQERYGDLGWVSVKDIRKADPREVIEELGEREGKWLLDVSLGKDERQLELEAAAKSISHETTFERDIRELAMMRHHLKSLSAKVASEAREEKVTARTVTVRARDDTFKTRQASKTIRDGHYTDEAVYKQAVELLDRLRAANQRPLRLLGVGLSNFTTSAEAELDLDLEPNKGHSRDKKISEVLDRIRARHGRDAAGYGSDLATGGRKVGKEDGRTKASNN